MTPPLPRVAVPVPVGDVPVVIRDMRRLRALIPRGELHPDAVIRALEIRAAGAFVIAELPLQLELPGVVP